MSGKNDAMGTHFYFVLSCDLSRFFMQIATKILQIIDNLSPFFPSKNANSNIKKVVNDIKWTGKI